MIIAITGNAAKYIEIIFRLSKYFGKNNFTAIEQTKYAEPEREPNNNNNSLIKTKSISTQQYDEYTYSYENASSQLESAKASLQQAQIQFDYTKIHAPIDGIVGIKKACRIYNRF